MTVCIFVWMTNNKRSGKDIIPSPKPKKSKGPVTLGWSTFNDEIIRKYESQSSVGPQTIVTRHPIISFQATGSPSIASVEIHSKTEGFEQSFQDIENSQPRPSQEGNSSNLHEREGETGNPKI